MDTMKACVLHGVGDLRYEDVPIPEIKPGEVLVKVKASGICGSDIARVFTTGTYHFPTIPGHEFAGEVVKAACEEDAHLVGIRAAIFPLIPCQECNSCHVGKYEMCKNYNYLGSRCDGGFAEYVAVPVWNLLPIPDNMSFEEAAMTEPTAVAIHALRRAHVEVGDSVAIFGPGTIGLLLAQWARAWGAERVMLIGIDDEQLEFARKLGFDCACNSLKEDPIAWVNKLTNGMGADIAIEAVGLPLTLENCLNCVASGGKIIALGNPKGDFKLEKDIYWQLLRKQAVIFGTWNSSYDKSAKNDWAVTVDAVASNKVQSAKQITHRLPLEKLMDGLLIMKDNTEYFNKVMIVMD